MKTTTRNWQYVVIGTMVSGFTVTVILSGCFLTPFAAYEDYMLDENDVAKTPIYCVAGVDCEEKWGRAIHWVSQNSHWEIKKQTNNLITTEKGPSGTDYVGYIVKMTHRGDGRHEIDIQTHCNNMFGCDQGINTAEFVKFVSQQSFSHYGVDSTRNMVTDRKEERATEKFLVSPIRAHRAIMDIEKHARLTDRGSYVMGEVENVPKYRAIMDAKIYSQPSSRSYVIGPINKGEQVQVFSIISIEKIHANKVTRFAKVLAYEIRSGHEIIYGHERIIYGYVLLNRLEETERIKLD